MIVYYKFKQKDVCPGPVVKGGDPQMRGHEFESCLQLDDVL